MSGKSEVTRPQGLYDKYVVLDAATGEKKNGRYFCLRMDAKELNEFKAVVRALYAYASVKRVGGHNEIADDIQRAICHEVAMRYGNEVLVPFDKPKEETNVQA